MLESRKPILFIGDKGLTKTKKLIEFMKKLEEQHQKEDIFIVEPYDSDEKLKEKPPKKFAKQFNKVGEMFDQPDVAEFFADKDPAKTTFILPEIKHYEDADFYYKASTRGYRIVSTFSCPEGQDFTRKLERLYPVYIEHYVGFAISAYNDREEGLEVG
jgi:hypothetical protein